MGVIASPAAGRAERAEAGFWAGYARNIPTSDETRDTGAVPVAGGYALALQGTYLEYGLAVGSTRALRPDDLRIVDEFYGDRGVPSRLELHPAVAERDAQLLAKWGYERELELTVLERALPAAPIVPGDFAVESMKNRRSEWVDLVVTGFLDTVDADGLARLRRTVSVCAAAATDLFGARAGGKFAGGAALAMNGDAALLLSASTLPEFRHSGVHSALMSARLQAAQSRGATYAFLKAPGAAHAVPSAIAAGFAVAYVRPRLRKMQSAAS
jgi:GNAT superfamily N-acetyltransferase